MKILHKLLLSFLVITSLISVAGYFSLNEAKKSLKESIIYNSRSLAHGILNEIDRSIYNRIEALEAYSNSTLLRQAVEDSNLRFQKLDDIQTDICEIDKEWAAAPKDEITPFMRKLMENRLSQDLRNKVAFYKKKYGYRLFGEIFVTNKYGANIGQTSKTTHYRQDDESWWQKAKTSGFSIKDVAYDKSSGVYSTDIGIRIDDENGNFIGVMKAVLNIKESIGIINRFKMSHTNIGQGCAAIHLTTRDGKIVYSTDKDKLFEAISRLQKHSGSIEREDDENGKEKILSVYDQSRGYKTFAGFGWILVIDHRIKDIFAPITRLRNGIITILFAVTILAFFISMLFSRSIVKPILKLRDAANNIGRGNLDTKIEISSNNEIGQLACSFSKMTQELSNMIASIRDLDKEIVLLKRVERKTRRQNKLSNAINKVFHETLACETHGEVAHTCLNAAQELTGSEFGFVGLVNEAGRFDTLAMSDPGWEACIMPKSDLVLKLRDIEIRGYWGRGVKEEKSQIVNEPETDPDRIGLPEGHPPINCFLGIPLKWMEQTVGIIALANKKSGYGLWDQKAVETLSTVFLEALNRKLAEEALQESKEALENALGQFKDTQAQMIHSEKMASIGQLAAGVAHEINNPIGFVSSNVNTLSEYQAEINRLLKAYRKVIESAREVISPNEDNFSLSEQMKRIRDMEAEMDINFIMDDVHGLIQDSLEGANRIRKIVADLKDFAHPGEDDTCQLVDINNCLESTLNVVWNEIKYKATVTKEYGKIPVIECYPHQLNQVFANILVNAAQAIDKQGDIKISTRTRNGNVEIKISDSGSGISKEDIGKIFDPFFTTKDVGKGTGLGLNISYNIIKKHNGDIEVESEPARGTTFTINLPTAQQESTGSRLVL